MHHGTVTFVGRTHGNFWPEWWADQLAANLSQANGDYTTWSAYSDSPPLASNKARAVFAAGLKKYQAASLLTAASIDVGIGGDCAHVKLDMPVHEVALIEFSV